MDVLVPFSATRPKTRLSDTLTPDERRAFARTMLDDVLAAVANAGGSPHVLATEDVTVDVPVTVDDRALTTAVNDALEEAHPIAVVMSDLALATPQTLSSLFATDGDVVIAPGRGGGTNALVVRDPEFHVDYHGASYRDHLDRAAAVDATVREFDSHRLATDVDERSDLAELLLHGEGAARDWLVDAGFELAVDEGRVGVERDRRR
ncbi:2-phospho-L-lactate guanylyltransferase [Haloparvum sp. AD34]